MAPTDDVDSRLTTPYTPAKSLKARPPTQSDKVELDRGVPEPLPCYKKRPEACLEICSALAFPAEAAVDDDALDAFVGYKLAEQFIIGEAEWFGSPKQGGYVLPKTERAQELYRALDEENI